MAPRCTVNIVILPVISIVKRNKSLSSSEWLERRRKDPYVEKAKRDNYRCRSAYKLIEIDDRFKLIKPGQCVVDIGAAPGSWSQVLVRRTNADKKDDKEKVGGVISLDRSYISPIEGATIISGLDFTKAEAVERICTALHGRSLDFVLSDMAPNASGVKSLDKESMQGLGLRVLEFAVKNLTPGGGCLIKMWDGSHDVVVGGMKRFFASMRHVKPKSSHSESAEIFLLARGFKGVKEARLGLEDDLTYPPCLPSKR